MKAFRFKQFEIQQSKAVFRVGTDAVLIGALANVEEKQHVLEVGTGTGIISLMLAQRNSSAIFLALDIDVNAVELASTNFKNSFFGERLSVQEHNFNDFKTEQKYDLIVSNPPYFEASNSDKDKVARQMILLNFEQLIGGSSNLLSEDGVLSIIVPFDVIKVLNLLAEKYNLHLVRQVTIIGIEGGEPKRVILDYSRKLKEIVFETFVVETSPRVYSEQYIEATKDFHMFKYN